MKKLLTVMLSVLMLLVTSVSVFAEDTKDTNLTYTVTESYEWTQPSAITFTTESSGTTQTGNLQVTKCIIANGKVLNIYAKGSGTSAAFTITDGSDALTYTLKAGDTSVATGGKALTLAAGANLTTLGTVTITFDLTDANAGKKAGTFIGTCTFEAKVEDAE